MPGNVYNAVITTSGGEIMLLRTVEMRKLMLIALFMSVLLMSNASAETICGPEAVPDAPEEYRMEESLFTLQEALDTFPYLETRIYEFLEQEEKARDVLTTPEFYIRYPNSLRVLKGTLLKQAVVIAQQRLELAEMRKPLDEAAVKKAGRDYKEAKREFCEFMKTAVYVD
jgi:hypothetical protein